MMAERKTKHAYLKKAGFWFAEIGTVALLMAVGYLWILVLFALAGPGGSL